MNPICTTCNRTLRIESTPVGTSPDGTPINQIMGYCDYCKIKYNSNQFQYPNQVANQVVIVEDRRKNGFGLASLYIGIGAIIFSPIFFGGLFGLLGLIFSIIGLSKKQTKYSSAILGLILNVMAIVFSCAILFSNSVKQTTQQTEPQNITYITQQPEAETTIEEQIIYDSSDVLIKVMGCEKASGNYLIKIYIENNSALNLNFNAHSYAVNGIMTRESIYSMRCDVASGKKANATLKIEKSFLSENDIDLIKSLDILFWAYDNDKMFKSFDTGQITVFTNHYDGSIASIAGTEIYNSNNISVDFLNVNGNTYTYCLTNKTGNYFNFDVSNISINDYTVTDIDFKLYDEQVLNNCSIIFSITVDKDFLDTNEIQSIEKIEFNLDIRPNGDYSDKWSTENIITGN